MSTEITFDVDDLILEFARNVGVALPVEWDRRQISLKELEENNSEISHRILNLFQCLIDESENSDHLAAYLAMAGTHAAGQELIRDIQQLICTPEGVVARGVSHSKISKFWQKYKTEIIIGTVVVAVVVSVAVIVYYHRRGSEHKLQERLVVRLSMLSAMEKIILLKRIAYLLPFLLKDRSMRT